VRHSLRRTFLAAGLILATTACTNASSGAGTEGSPKAAESAAGTGSVDAAAAKLLPADIKSKGVLTAASDASYRPYEYFDTDNKTMIGFDVDLTDALGERLGLQVKHVNAGFDSILPGLAAKKYDVGASAFSITPERSETVEFVPYLNNGSGLAVEQGNPLGLKMDAKALCGYAVSGQKGSVQGLDQLPALSKVCTKAGKKPIEIELFPSQNGANLAVISGRVDAVMADTVALSLEAKASGGKLEMAPGPDYEPTPTGVALSKGSPLEPALDAAMKTLLSDGTMDALMKKWDIPASARLKAEN